MARPADDPPSPMSPSSRLRQWEFFSKAGQEGLRKEIAELKAALDEQEKAIKKLEAIGDEKDKSIEKLETAITEKDRTITRLKFAVGAKDKIIDEQRRKVADLPIGASRFSALPTSPDASITQSSAARPTVVAPGRPLPDTLPLPKTPVTPSIAATTPLHGPVFKPFNPKLYAPSRGEPGREAATPSEFDAN